MMFKSQIANLHRALPAMVGFALLFSPVASLAGVPSAVGQVPQEQRKICSEPIRQQEREVGIPNQLLAAVARAESGRWDKTAAASFAWPWTVTAEGKGQFFASKEEAIQQVERLRGRGVRNIDVGCMQVNLLHHPDAFANLEEAFEPRSNVAYASNFLKQLFEQNRSWVKAVGNYHSATPEFHMRYRDKVMKLWTDERRRDAEARRQETIAAYQQRRQQVATQQAQQRAEPSATAPLDDVASRETAKFDVADSRPAATQHTTGSIAAIRPNLSATMPSHTPAPPTSFRVLSQIPSTAAPAPGRVLPRSTMVPMERRF